jgi:hypothetical protein
MNGLNPSSWRQWMTNTAGSVFIAAILLYVAARLIEAVWWVLVLVVSAIAIVAIIRLAMRRRNSGW